MKAIDKNENGQIIIRTYEEAIKLTKRRLSQNSSTIIDLSECDFSNFEYKCFHLTVFINKLLYKEGLKPENNQCIIPYELSLIDCCFNQIKLNNLTFNGNVDLSRTSIESITIGKCVFESDVSLVNIKIATRLFITDSEAHKKFTFEESTINGLIDLYKNNLFGSLIFNFCELYNRILVDSKTTISELQFIATKVKAGIILGYRPANPCNIDKIDFSDTEIDSYIELQSCNCKSVSFERVRINESGSMSISNSNISDISLVDINSKGRINFVSGKIKRLDANRAIIKDSFFISDYNVVEDVSNRYTARLLKHESIKVNDIITSTYFRKLEMEQYYQELNQFKWHKQLPEKITLFLNSFSNEQGFSWWRGVKFTLTIAILFYLIYSFFSFKIELINLHDDNWLIKIGQNWKGVLQYLWLPDSASIKELKENTDIGFWGTFFYIFGKIFIAYGIYQTISAFRKFGSSKS